MPARVLTAALLVLLATGCSTAGGAAPAPAGMSTSASPSSAASAPAQTGAPRVPASDTHLGVPVEPAAGATVLVHPGWDLVTAAATGSRLWVASPAGLGWVDPAGTTFTEVGTEPGSYVVVVGDRLVRGARDADRLEVRSASDGRPLHRLAWPSPDGLAVAGTQVWVASRRAGTVARLDPATGTTGRPVRIGVVTQEGLGGPGAMTVADGVLWSASPVDRALLRVDVASGRVLPACAVGWSPSGVLVHDGLVWTYDLTSRSDVVALDERTCALVARVPLRLAPRDVTGVVVPHVVDGQLWAVADDTLEHLGRSGGGWRVDRVLRLPRTDAVPMSATEAFGALWILEYGGNLVRVPAAALGAPSA